MAGVLVVDDDPVICDVVGRYLEQEGFVVWDATDGHEARRQFEAHRPSLVVLDVMLPVTSGLELCRWIRDQDDTPVILLTARSEEADRIVGLELGADDYMTKPFSPRELVARVKTVLRRTDPPRERAGPIRAGPLRIDEATRDVDVSGRTVSLTALEFELLRFLATHPRVVFSREQLLSQVWGYDAALEAGTAAVTVQIRRLREKIELDPSAPTLIQTVWGVGYRLSP
jgi:two-component system response regulator ResD